MSPPNPDLARLDAFLCRLEGGIALAYSGGVDSSFLKWRLEMLNRPFACVQVKVPMLSVPQVAQNAVDRCYHCKRALFAHVRAVAKQQGLAQIIDGTNADDLKVYRPGLRALEEMGIISPLAAVGLGKARLRALAREANLPFADKPATPCLATRFPYGTPLTLAALARVAAAEEYLARHLPAYTNIRVRCDAAGQARIEVAVAALPAAREQLPRFTAHLLSLGFITVTLDPRGFQSGSYDNSLPQ